MPIVEKSFSDETNAIIRTAIKLAEEYGVDKPPTSLSIEVFTEEIFELSKSLSDIKIENETTFYESLRSTGELFDIVLSQHVSLYFILRPFSDLSIDREKPIAEEDYSFRALRTFCALLNNACNCLIAVKYVSQLGLDVQARVLFRNYIECMDLGLAILLDEGFLAKYLLDPQKESEKGEKWSATRPAKVISTITKAVKGYESLDQIWQVCLQQRKPHYSVTSMAAHADVIAVFYGSYPTMINTDQVHNGLGGIISNAARATLLDAFNYACLILNFLEPLVEKRHGIGNFSEFSKDGDLYYFIKYIVNSVYMEMLLREYRNTSATDMATQ